MASRARRISNNAGSANSFLNAVAVPDTVSKHEANALVAADAIGGKKEAKLIKSILSVIQATAHDQNTYSRHLDSKVVDVTLGRIATLLDEFGDTLDKEQLTSVKEEILKAIKSKDNDDLVTKAFLENAIASLFDDIITKSDVEDIKKWISETIQKDNTEQLQVLNDEFSNKESNEKTIEDTEVGEYKDSTPAENFMALQNYVSKQFDILNENLKNIPGGTGMMTRIYNAIGKGFSGVVVGIAKLSKGIAKTISKTASIAKSIGKFGISALVVGISGIAKGVGSVIKGIGSLGKGIGSLGSKIGKGIASPFKAAGKFISSLNPFQRSQKKLEDRKQKAKDKVMEVMAKVIDKIWKVIEPFIDKVGIFMGLMTKFVIVPIALIALKVLFIVASIIAIGVGLVLAYMWIKKKIASWVEYFKSGKWWVDLKAKLLATWEWTKDFGKWIWDKLVDFGKTLWGWYLAYLKFVFIDIWVWVGKKIAEFGVWIWNKLLEFGKWLYDNYIYKYVVQPFKQYVWDPIKKLWNGKVWPMIQPFVQSLTELKDKIVNAFSAWDTNKSIWENLKNMTSIIKDAILEWWETSPFKAFYEKYLEPFVTSAGELFDKLKNLSGFIKDAIMAWWNGDSSLGDTLKNIGSKVWDTIKEWWNGDNVFRTTWEKAKDYFNDVIKPLKEWYKQSDLKIWIDSLISKVNAFKERIGNIVWDLPGIPMFRPFGFLVGKSFSMTNEEKEQYKQQERFNKLQKELDDITAGNKVTNWRGKDITNERKQEIEADMAKMGMSPRQIASQQINQAAKPIQQIEQMNNESSIELKKTGEEINQDIAAKEEKREKFDVAQADKSDKILARIDSLDAGINKKLDDPLAVPVPFPMPTKSNSAIMENY